MKKSKFATSFIINQLGLLVEDKCLNDTCAEHLVMSASKRLEDLEQELATIKTSLPKIKADAVRDYEESLSSFHWTADEYIKNKLEAGE